MDTRDLIQIIAGVKPSFSPEQVYDYIMFFEKPKTLPGHKINNICKDLYSVMDDLASKNPEFAHSLKLAIAESIKPQENDLSAGLLDKSEYEQAIRSYFKNHFKKRVLDELKRKPFPDSDTNFEFSRLDITGWSGLEVSVEPKRYKPPASVTKPALAPSVEVKASLELKSNLEIEAVRETTDDNYCYDKIISTEQWTASVDSKITASYYFNSNSRHVESLAFNKDPEMQLSFQKRRSQEEINESLFLANGFSMVGWGLGILFGAVLPIGYLIEEDSLVGCLGIPIGIAFYAAAQVFNNKCMKQDLKELNKTISAERYDRKIPL